MATVSQQMVGDKVIIRSINLSDCTKEYVAWLNDPLVNRYLETRFLEQTLGAVTDFVSAMVKSEHSYLFAMISNDEEKRHIGNIKLGPIHPHYLYGDISYFIGEKDYWGKGIAVEAISLVTDFAFEYLDLHRVQAGVFEDNIGSIKALERSGFLLEGRQRKQLCVNISPEDKTNQLWQDHLFYGRLHSDV